MAEMGTMASRPSTPVVATPIGSVPLYDVPIMPTLPVVQSAKTCSEDVGLVKALARPFSQSTIAFGPSVSNGSPVVGQPSERPVPVPSPCTTAKPRGSPALTCEVHALDARGEAGDFAVDGAVVLRLRRAAAAVRRARARREHRLGLPVDE